MVSAMTELMPKFIDVVLRNRSWRRRWSQRQRYNSIQQPTGMHSIITGYSALL